MTPVQSFEAKRQRVKQSMKDLGFTELQIQQIMTGLKPGNVDSVIETLLEEFETLLEEHKREGDEAQ